MTITLNLRKRLLKVHMPLRRRRISTYAREAIARFAKADIEKIRFDSNLNRHLILRIARKPVKFKVTVEKLDKVVNVRLFGAPDTRAKAAPAKEKKAAAKPAEPKGNAAKPEAAKKD
jgi:ribosomal protein L31E